MEAESSYKTSEIYQSTWHHIPENWNLHHQCCENLRSSKLGPPVSVLSLFGTSANNFCFILTLQEYVEGASIQQDSGGMQSLAVKH